jgi:hypothetical protein
MKEKEAHQGRIEEEIPMKEVRKEGRISKKEGRNVLGWVTCRDE